MSKLYLGNKLIIDPDLKLEKKVLTQKDYDNLSTKQNNVIYFVTDAPSPFSRLIEVEDYLNTHKNDEDIHVPIEREEGQLLSVDENDYLNWRNLDKSDVGLDKVDNTADIDKPVSTAQQQAITSAKNSVNSALANHLNDKNNPHKVNKSQVGLSNVTNDAQVKRSEMGVASGVATLDSNGKVPSSQLPSYVDDVLEYSNKSAFPVTGETGKIYVDTTANLTYRWSGSQYVEISPSLALGETSSTAYSGDKGKATTDKVNTHVANTTNPHNVTKAQVGLSNVDNTSDLDKPLSNIAQAIINNIKGQLSQDENYIRDNITSIRNNTISINNIHYSKGQPNGFATLDSNGKIPTSQLPADIGGSSLEIGETTGTAYDGAKGKKNADDIIALTTTVGNKVDKVTGKGLSTNDYTNEAKAKLDGIGNFTNDKAGLIKGYSLDDYASNNFYIKSLRDGYGYVHITDATTSQKGIMSSSDKTKLDGIEAGAQVNSVTSVNGQTGAVVVESMTTADRNKINKLPYIVEIDNCEIEEDTLNNYIIATLTLSENSISVEELSQIASNTNSRAKFIIEGNLKVNKAEGAVSGKTISVYVNGLISQKHGMLQGIISDSNTIGSSSYATIETAGFSVNNNIITLKYRSSVV